MWLRCGISRLTFSFIISLSFANHVKADEQWSLCSQNIPERQTSDKSLLIEKKTPDQLIIDADTSNAKGTEIEFNGNVVARYQDQQLQTDQLFYDREKRKMQTRGWSRAWLQDVYISTPLETRVDLDKETYYLPAADYFFTDRNANGSSNAIVHQKKKRVTILYDGSYSTCPPFDPAWQVVGKKIRLDHKTGTGSILHGFFKVKGVPVFYFPYLTFPIDNKRKSGFLVPTLETSGRSGYKIYTPYYWNIAPEMDATLGPHYIEKRGLMGVGEFRYLGSGSQGTLSLEYLANDSLTNSSRYFFRAKHQKNNLPLNFRFDSDFSQVSDRNYLEDFGSGLKDSSTTYLERYATLNGNGRFWRVNSHLRDFQVTSSSVTRTPYKELPRISLDLFSERRSAVPQVKLASEYVHFYRPSTLTTNTESIHRTDLTPTLTLPIENYAYSIEGNTGIRFTHYQVTRQRRVRDQSHSRTVPFFSLRGKIYFERDSSIFRHAYTQALEPELFYLIVPYVEQSDIPVLDSSRLTPSLLAMFSENRYVGADRVGDAHLVSTAITNRLLSSKGKELAALTVAQGFYFHDRRVTLPRKSPEQGALSPLTLYGIVSPIPEVRFFLDYQRELRIGRTQHLYFGGQYQSKPNKKIEIRYDFASQDPGETLKYISAFTSWPINAHWSIVSKWGYELQQKKLVESAVGVQYDGCCFAVVLSAQRYLNSAQGSYDTHYLFRIKLGSGLHKTRKMLTPF